MAKTLKETLAAQIPKLREDRMKLVKGYGAVKISDATIAQAIGGMRGIKSMCCDTSVVEPDKGLIIREVHLNKLTKRLPEEIFWMLLIGKPPTKAQLEGFQKELKTYGKVPDYVWKILRAMPKASHPMAMLDTAILAMENESVFRKEYTKGLAKTD